MKITLKDGMVKEYESKMSVLDIAKDISEGLARAATSAKVNGEIADLRTEVGEDCELEILTFDSEDGKEHSGIPLLISWLRLSNGCIPETKLAIGTVHRSWILL